MSTQVQRRKGTTAQHATFTGASAELTVDTTKNTVVVHDGATAGGIPLAKETGSAISATSLTGPHNGTVGATTANTGAFTTLSASSTVTISGGTANGVTYLNGSKVLTSGTALTFDGTNLSTMGSVTATGSDTGDMFRGLNSSASNRNDFVIRNAASNMLLGAVVGSTGILASNVEGMRLTSTGLGIGTTSPRGKLDVNGNTYLGANSGSISVILSGDTTTTGGFIYEDQSQMILSQVTAGPIVFRTTNTERMRLDSSGNLGLGTNSPSASYNLTLAGATAANGIIIYNTSDSSRGGRLRSNGTGAVGVFDISTTSSGYALTFGIDVTEKMRLDASGRLLVGTTAVDPVGSRVDGTVIGSGASSFGIRTRATAGYSYIGINSTSGVSLGFYTDNGTAFVAAGNISSNGSTTTYNTSSDYRLKNITGPITTSGAYIDSLKPVEGTWKADGSTFVGLIAHETQEASRTAVATGTKDGDEMQGMDYSSAEIIANLIAELQSVRTRLAALEAK